MSGQTQNGYTGNLAGWMAGLNSTLTMTQLSVPGTHDSGTQNVPAGPYHTQNFGIGTQLDDGIRFLDIRLAASTAKNPSADDPLQVNHGSKSCDLSFGEVLNDCGTFLQSNPGEVIFMLVNDASGSATSEMVYNGFPAYLKNSAYQNLFCLDPDAVQLPLSQLRGKIVLLRRFFAPADTVLGLNLQQQGETFQNVGWPNNYSASFTTTTPDGKTSLVIEDQYNTSKLDSKMDAVVAALSQASGNPDDGKLYLSFNSIAYNGNTPYHFAWGDKKNPMNPSLHTWLQGRPGKARFGFVMLDFYNNESGSLQNGNVKTLVGSNFS